MGWQENLHGSRITFAKPICLVNLHIKFIANFALSLLAFRPTGYKVWALSYSKRREFSDCCYRGGSEKGR